MLIPHFTTLQFWLHRPKQLAPEYHNIEVDPDEKDTYPIVKEINTDKDLTFITTFTSHKNSNVDPSHQTLMYIQVWI